MNKTYGCMALLFFLSGCTPSFTRHDHIQENKAKPPVSPSVREGKRSPGMTAKVHAHTVKRPVIIPTQLEIPSIKLNTAVERVGILPNGQMGVPHSFEKVGILVPWTKPGENGNAVISGHFDHHTGPAVFYNLRKLKSGDRVIVSDGQKKLVFIVKRVESFKTQEAPLERIFGKSQGVHLNLITCAGKFNKKTREHARRLVVFTEMLQ